MTTEIILKVPQNEQEILVALNREISTICNTYDNCYNCPFKKTRDVIGRFVSCHEAYESILNDVLAMQLN